MDELIKLNIIEGVRITEERGQIISAVRVVEVSGLTPAGDVGKRAMALSGVPKYTEPYFGDPWVTLIGREWDANDRIDGGRITLTYKRRETGETEDPPGVNYGITVGTTGRQVTTEKDRNGNVIKVLPPTIRDPSQNTPEDTITIANGGQTGSVVADEADDTVQVRRIITTNEPGAITRRFGNKMNSVAFQGDPKHTWRCVGAEAEFQSIDPSTSQMTWDFTFTIQRFREGCNPIAIYWDNERNQADMRIVSSQKRAGLDGELLPYGIDRINWYETEDLNQILAL